MSKILKEALTFDDVLLVPAKSDILEIKVGVGDRMQGGLSTVIEFSGE